MKGLSLLLLLILALPVLAVSPDQHVDNFELLDHAGISHELYYLSDAKAIVFMVQGNGCPIVRNALPDLKTIRDTYADQGIEFLMINSNIQDNRTTIAKEAEEYDISIPILVDETQLIGESLGLVRTGEVFVINPKTWSVVYTGPLNDRLTYESQKATTKHHYLKDALDDLLANETVKVPVYYGNEERWKNFRKRGVLRDKNNALILPLIMFKRTDVSFDDAVLAVVLLVVLLLLKNREDR